MIRDSARWTAPGSRAGPGGHAFICEIRPLTNTLSNLGNDLQHAGVGVAAVKTPLQRLRPHGSGAPLWWPFDPAAAGSRKEPKRELRGFPSSHVQFRTRTRKGLESSAKSRSLSASRARQNAAGRKMRGTPCGMTRDPLLRRLVKARTGAKQRFAPTV